VVELDEEYGVPVDVAERIRERGADLTAAERRIAEVVLEAPQSIGFGTVADLARAAQVGAASVVRLATKLGFDGYSELQQAIQSELMQQLRPAVERIQTADLGSRSDHVAAELANVETTLTGIDDASLALLVDRLADLDRPVMVLSGDASAGVARQFVTQLHQLRPHVTTVGGSDVEVRRELALADGGATMVVIDLRRYEQWVLDAHRFAVDRDIWSAGITDSMLSPIASSASVTFVVGAASTGPFDSYVGMLALLNLVAIDVAAQLKDSATERLAAIETSWTSAASLTAGR
jgi:DNA-binding MurR/RpiR family transcriptional regulator